MMLGVVGQVDGRLVVHGERRLVRASVAEVREERTEVGGLFGRLAGGDDFGIVRRQRDGELFFRRPGDGCPVVHEGEAGRGVARGPLGVGEAVQVVGMRVLVPKDHCFVMVKVHQYATSSGRKFMRRTAHGAAEKADGVCDVGPSLSRAVE
eukprot:3069949-Pleurochrysis_carterae.AAC.1